MNRLMKFTILLALLLTGILGGTWYWQRTTRIRSTDNAYVNADIAQIASRLNGTVVAVYVHEGQLVAAGEALFDIDPEPYQVALELAKAKLELAEQGNRQDITDVNANDAAVEKAEADLANARTAARRTHSLVQQHFLPPQADDDAKARVKVAEAAVAEARAKLAGAKVNVAPVGDAIPSVLAARAAVKQAELNLKYTRVVADKTGWIVNLSLVPGSSVVAYMPLFALVERNSFWIDANFKETELPGIQPGQPVDVDIDMLPDHTYQGVVDVIENGTGAAFSLLPPQNATGNWVKVTQRIPVRIRLADEAENLPLRVGASAQVAVHIKN